MTMSNAVQRTPAQVREHYEVEKELANRLRIATTEERRKLYNVVYDERLRRIPHHPLLTQAVNPEAQLCAVTPQLRLLRSFVNRETVFLEVGPGDCALALAIAEHVKKVYAVDVSEGLVQDTIRPANFEFHLSDGIRIPVPPNSVDLAYSNQVMEHLHPDDARDQLRSIYDALAPGGMYICITPNRLSGPWDISRHFDEIATGLHLKEYTNTELAKVFKSVGFSKVNTFVSCAGYILSPQLSVALVALIERILGKSPRVFSKNAANFLTAFKVVAIK